MAKYAFENVVQSAGIGNDGSYHDAYGEFEFYEFEADSDAAAVKVAEKLQKKGDQELLGIIMASGKFLTEDEAKSSDEYALAPSLINSLVRIELDPEDGTENRIPYDDWDI